MKERTGRTRVRCIAAALALAASSAAADEPREIPLLANDLVWDPVHARLYASVSAADSQHPNSVVWIDPVAGTIGGWADAGPEPGRLALSADGTTLYVALRGDPSVRRMQLDPLAPGLSVALGSDPSFGPRHAEDLAVLPGDANAFAVARMYKGASPRHAGVAVYDGDVMRAGTTPGHTGSNAICFADDTGLLYGINMDTTEFGFRRMSVDAQGVSVVDVTQGLSSFFQGVPRPLIPAGGLLYLANGRAIDPVAKTVTDTFALSEFPTNSPGFAIDTAAGLAYFLSGTSVSSFDMATGQRRGALPLPPQLGARVDLVRWGADGLATRTATTVELLSVSDVSEPPEVDGVVAPANLAALVFRSPDRVLLTWTDQSTAETAYEVERRLPPASFDTMATLPPNALSYFDLSIVGLYVDRYEYRVRAVSDDEQSDYTAPVSAIVEPSGLVSLSIVAGRLRDVERPAGDLFEFVGRFSRPDGYDPREDGLIVSCGLGSDPFVLDVPPGDPGWRQRRLLGRKVLVWHSAGRRPRALVIYHAQSGVFGVAIRKFDFPASPLPAADTLHVGLRLGFDGTTDIQRWRQRGRHALRFQR